MIVSLVLLLLCACSRALQQFYFAYGSNLNGPDWLAFGRRRGAVGFRSLAFVGVAELPGFELRFTFHSTTRRGGVLDVIEHPFSSVAGGLFWIDDTDLAWLDKKEGVEHGIYCKRDVTVRRFIANTLLFVDLRALTYAVCDGARELWVQPSAAYVDVVLGGLLERRVAELLPTCAPALLRAACSDDVLFVYGTLRHGGSANMLLVDKGFRRVRSDTKWVTAGVLLDLGEFPALVLNASRSGARVVGELWQSANGRAPFEALDQYEGLDTDPPLYSRVCTRVSTVSGDASTMAWLYVMDSVPAALQGDPPVVASGDWLEK